MKESESYTYELEAPKLIQLTADAKAISTIVLPVKARVTVKLEIIKEYK